MRTSSSLIVGSPTTRAAAIGVATLLLALSIIGAGIAGSRLLAADGALVVDPNDASAYQTISAAVAAAGDGDTILIRPGTYEESVAITSDIALEGDGARGGVVIAFASPDDGAAHLEGGPDGEPFGYGILLQGSDARVSNLTIQGPPADGSDPAVSALYIEGGAPIIDGIDIVLDGDRWTYSGGSYYRRSALRVTGGSTATVRGSSWDGYVRIFGGPNAPTFEDNTITGHHVSIVDPGQEPVMRRNRLLESAALLWEGDSGGLAEDNDISGWIGIAQGDPVVRGNRIRGGRDGSIRLGGIGPRHAGPGTAISITGGTPTIESNDVMDSTTGILVSGFDGEAAIAQNTITGMSSFAIRVSFGTFPSVEENIIEDNATGVAAMEPSWTDLRGNTFCGNAQDLMVVEGSALTLDGNTVCPA